MLAALIPGRARGCIASRTRLKTRRGTFPKPWVLKICPGEGDDIVVKEEGDLTGLRVVSPRGGYKQVTCHRLDSVRNPTAICKTLDRFEKFPGAPVFGVSVEFPPRTLSK